MLSMGIPIERILDGKYYGGRGRRGTRDRERHKEEQTHRKRQTGRQTDRQRNKETPPA